MALTQVKTSGIADDAVTQDKVANDAIDLTEIKAGTDGNLITYDASGNPTVVATGNDGQVLTSQGAGNVPQFETLPASGVTVSNNSNNRVVTGDGSNLNAEANLTFDGDNLTQTTDGDGEGIVISNSGNTYNQFTFDANRSGADAPIGAVFAKWNGNVVGSVQWNTGADTTNKDDGYFDLRTTEGGTNTERVRVHQGGNVEIKTGNLIIGTSGKGIDFSAHGNAGGSTSELLDDYETGTWTIGGDDPNFNGFGSVDCHYSKVGRLVTISGTMVCNTNTSGTSFYVKFIPFAPDTKINIPVASAVSAADDGLFFFIDAGATTGYLRNASYGIQSYNTFSNKTLYFTCSYVSNA
jgi:hypothetical protein